jgi:hypothetical protein
LEATKAVKTYRSAALIPKFSTDW